MKTIDRAIRPNKSFIYPINFCFKYNRDYYFEKIDSIIETLLDKNKFKDRENLELVKASEEREMLGIAIASDGNMSDKMKLL